MFLHSSRSICPLSMGMQLVCAQAVTSELSCAVVPGWRGRSMTSAASSARGSLDAVSPRAQGRPAGVAQAPGRGRGGRAGRGPLRRQPVHHLPPAQVRHVGRGHPPPGLPGELASESFLIGVIQGHVVGFRRTGDGRWGDTSPGLLDVRPRRVSKAGCDGAGLVRPFRMQDSAALTPLCRLPASIFPQQFEVFENRCTTSKALTAAGKSPLSEVLVGPPGVTAAGQH